MFNKRSILIKKIEGASIPSKTQALASEIAENRRDIDVNAANRRRWTVVPVPDEPNFCDAEWLANASHGNGVEQAIAFPLHVPPKHPDLAEFLSVPMTRDAIMEIAYEAAFIPYLLVAATLEFCVLLPGDDYFLVAGPASFVEKAIGCTLDTAKTNFVDDWAKGSDNPAFTKNMLKVWQRYEHLLPSTCVDTQTSNREFNGGELAESTPNEVRSLPMKSQVLNALESIAPDGELNLQLLKERGWKAIPSSPRHDARSAQWIADAMSSIHVDIVYVVLGAEGDRVVALPASRDGIHYALSRKFHPPFALLTQDSAFAVLVPTAEYCVIAGPPEFVGTALGCSFETARLMFIQDWVELDDRPNWKEDMLAVWNRYEDFAKM